MTLFTSRLITTLDLVLDGGIFSDIIVMGIKRKEAGYIQKGKYNQLNIQVVVIQIKDVYLNNDLEKIVLENFFHSTTCRFTNSALRRVG